MNKKMRLLAVGLALFQAAHWSVLAQSGAPLATPGIMLEVQTRNSQKTFRVGEIIPLELRFQQHDRKQVSTFHPRLRPQWQGRHGDLCGGAAFGMARSAGPILWHGWLYGERAECECASRGCPLRRS